MIPFSERKLNKLENGNENGNWGESHNSWVLSGEIWERRFNKKIIQIALSVSTAIRIRKEVCVWSEEKVLDAKHN